MGVGRDTILKMGLLSACLIVGPALTARADTFTILSGTIVLSRSNVADITVQGSGISVRGDMQRGVEQYVPPTSCFQLDCGASFTLSIADTVSNELAQLGGSIVADGLDYALTSFSYTISASPVAPPTLSGAGSSATIFTPFIFNGSLLANLNGTSRTFDLTGEGTARAEYLGDCCGWFSTTYAFAAAPAATPEPASLILLGTGALGILARRRWARRPKTGS